MRRNAGCLDSAGISPYSAHIYRHIEGPLQQCLNGQRTTLPIVVTVAPHYSSSNFAIKRNGRTPRTVSRAVNNCKHADRHNTQPATSSHFCCQLNSRPYNLRTQLIASHCQHGQPRHTSHHITAHHRTAVRSSRVKSNPKTQDRTASKCPGRNENASHFQQIRSLLIIC